MKDSEMAMAGMNEKQKSQEMNNIHDWTSEELLHEILGRLAKKKYHEVRGLINAARDGNVVNIFLELFPAIIEKYDENFMENETCDLILEEILTMVKFYGSTKERFLILLEYSSRVKSWKAFTLLGKFMEEVMLEMKDLNVHINHDIQKLYIPSWIERLGKNIVQNYQDDLSNREYYNELEADYLDRSNHYLPRPNLFSDTIFMFLRIFVLSMSEDYHLLDDLIDQVVACMHITSYHLQKFIKELDKIFKAANRALPCRTLVLASSINSEFCASPRIYSPEFRLKLAIAPLLHSLHVSTSNMFNVGYVVLVLRNYLVTIKDESFGRTEFPFFMDFLANFLICCEEYTLCKVREVCMDTFKILLSKFEPVAQILIIRKLISIIKGNKIELKFEPQLLAWLIDIYRSKLYYKEFCRELGFFWGDLVDIRYSRLSDALQFYLSIFIFAQEQALRRINSNLMLNIYEQFLIPVQSQISDWTVLVETQERHMEDTNSEMQVGLTNNMERLEMETHRKQDVQSLPLLQFQYLQTLNYVETFLRDAGLLQKRFQEST